MRLSKKEIARGLSDLTVAVRAQANKKIKVFLVKLDGTILQERECDFREEIPFVVAHLMRDCDKFYNLGDQMSDASRDRNFCAGPDNKIIEKENNTKLR